VLQRGRETASESYIHEYPVMFHEAREWESIRQTVAAFERVLKQPPLGYISPGHRPTDKTAEILAEAGYICDADFQERDTATVTAIAGRQMFVMPYAHMSDYTSLTEAPRVRCYNYWLMRSMSFVPKEWATRFTCFVPRF
jgi:hypothetical protein